MRTGVREAGKGSALARSEAGSASHPQSQPESRSRSRSEVLRCNAVAKRDVVLDRLRESIRRIESRTPTLSVAISNPAAGTPSGLVEDGGGFSPHAQAPVPPSSSASSCKGGEGKGDECVAPLLAQHIVSGAVESVPAWRLGDRTVDQSLLSQVLDAGAVHEIKPALQSLDNAASSSSSSLAPGPLAWAASWSAARAFLLRALIRRLQACSGQGSRHGAVLWCWPQIFAKEFGGLYGPGLAGLGLHSERLNIVEPSRSQDVLWAMEEGLKSAAVVCVVGVLDDIGLTPARRLALAAARTGVPALVLTGPRTPPMAATATRWRVGPAPSCDHPIDPALPGSLRLGLTLERCRRAPLAAALPSMTIAWCNGTRRFRAADEIQQQIRPMFSTNSVCEHPISFVTRQVTS